MVVTRIVGILLIAASGPVRNQKIGLYAVLALCRTGDQERTVIAKLLREYHPTELLQPCQECHTTEATIALATSLVIHLFLTFV